MLEQRERELLDFERDWATHAGRKEAAIRARFGISAARYYQLVNRLLDRPEALSYDPLTVKRLCRRRDERVRRRARRPLDEGRGL